MKDHAKVQLDLTLPYVEQEIKFDELVDNLIDTLKTRTITFVDNKVAQLKNNKAV